MLDSLPQRKCLICEHKDVSLINNFLAKKPKATKYERFLMYRTLMLAFRMKISMFREHDTICLPGMRARGEEIAIMDTRTILLDTAGRIDIVLDKCGTMLDRLNTADPITAGKTAADLVVGLEKLFDLRARIKQELSPEMAGVNGNAGGPQISVAMMLPTLPAAKRRGVIEARALEAADDPDEDVEEADSDDIDA